MPDNRKILGSGAEATVYLDGAETKSDTKSVCKERTRKSYRHEDIDLVLRKVRTKKEAKILKALERFGFSPRLLGQKEYDISMEYIDGIQLKKVLDKKPQLAMLIGKNLTIMHDLNLIHGDLTTSNMILVGKGKDLLKDKDAKLFFIDFGLSFNSSRVEDKAVDIHLFRQALESKHFKVFNKAYIEFLKGYEPLGKKDILERLRIVEQRGRYKEKT
jgi:TP53 regulating kinase and related kinases